MVDNPYKIAGNILSASLESDYNFRSVDLYGSSVRGKEDSLCSEFHLENESGTGDIAMYQIFPGMELVYNDMHMEYCNKAQSPRFGLIEINYCREGRCECAFGEYSYCYMASGNLSICSLQGKSHTSSFPTSHYHGITVIINLTQITDEMKRILELLSIDLTRISKFTEKQDFYMVRASENVRHIFLELYKVPEEIRYGYIRVKILELLLVLTGFDLKKNNSEHVYFSDVQIDAIKQVHAFLKGHYRGHYTIEELSVRFKMSPTVLKKCFKGVYGNSVYAYMKKYRLQMAERLLKENKLTIGEIALQIGYQNPNKFTSAFRTEYGMTPTEYRKKKTQESLNG